ncbi:alpha/beta fold hydrolase [Lachnospira multipara]|uniref:alpha/beta fold hydrolase n=1 Tax=Lachnospira multipara TaxID=28051 RepID=UPI00048628D9|nr:alpha/beta fold hydrolase [Lachnospira multipara]
MNKWQKIGLAASICGATLTTVHLINKFIFSTATAKGITNNRVYSTYPWKFGDINYCSYGEGSPILLIHDLNSYSSLYEWDNVIDELSKNHKVYAIDLLGCGKSDKPYLTYTTYMYTQLIADFINCVIREKTDVIVSGSSAPMVIASAFNNKDVINKIVLVSPISIKSALIGPNKQSKITRFILETPIIGTLVYNICQSKSSINKELKNDAFADGVVPCDFLDAYYENSHINGSSCKHLFTSKKCHYTTISLSRLLPAINNSIFIISGELDNNTRILEEYTTANNAIETFSIPNSKKLPQIEEPEEFVKQVEIFLA